MLDIGWQELLVVGVLALLVVGPKELPTLLRTVGQWVGKARGMAREFQRSMDDAAREADLEEFKKLKDLKRDFEQSTKIDFAEQAKRSQSFMAPKESGSAKAAADTSTTVPPATATKSTTPADPAPAGAPSATSGPSTASEPEAAAPPAASADAPKA